MAEKDYAQQSVSIDRVRMGLELLQDERRKFHALASVIGNRLREDCPPGEPVGSARDPIGLTLSELLEDMLGSDSDFESAEELMGLPKRPAKEESHG